MFDNKIFVTLFVLIFSHSQLSFAVTDGIPDPVAAKYTVFFNGQECTGILIDRQIVLTAAHCYGGPNVYVFFNDANGKRVFSTRTTNSVYKVFDGSFLHGVDWFLESVSMNHSQKEEVKDVWRTYEKGTRDVESGVDGVHHLTKSLVNYEVDFSAIHLKDPVPAELTPLSVLVRPPKPKDFKAKYILSGYGSFVRENSPSSDIPLSANVELIGYGVTEPVEKRPLVYYFDAVKEERQGCTGDSGGPIVQEKNDGTRVLVAIYTAGFDSNCENGGTGLNASLFLEGLKEYSRMQWGYDPQIKEIH